MNQITTSHSIKPLLLGLLLTTTISACSTAKTSSDAPNATDTNGQTSAPANTNTNTQGDAQSTIRKKQIESDIRAREQRNNIGGNPLKRDDSDLASQVRGKLEANMPNSKLAVDAKNAEVTVSGAVANQAQLDKIKPLAMQIKGVKNVMVKATVKPGN
jgi:hyperosmotically inducible periplasmic protein